MRRIGHLVHAASLGILIGCVPALADALGCLAEERTWYIPKTPHLVVGVLIPATLYCMWRTAPK